MALSASSHWCRRFCLWVWCLSPRLDHLDGMLPTGSSDLPAGKQELRRRARVFVEQGTRVIPVPHYG